MPQNAAFIPIENPTQNLTLKSYRDNSFPLLLVLPVVAFFFSCFTYYKAT